MAQRLAVLLAVASILVIVCAAEGPSMEPAATQMYDKKPHNKHEKYDKPDKHEKEYKPDGYKPDGYKPDGYKPDGYKPDGYKPDGYRPDGYQPEHEEHYGKHHKQPKGEYKEFYGGGGGGPKYGDSYGYEHNSYPEPNPIYDSGYYGGNGGGRHTLYFDVWQPEKMLNQQNATFPDSGVPSPAALCEQTTPENCDVDFGLICGLRKKVPYGPPADKSYGYNDEKYGSVISGTPVQPMSIAMGYTDGYITWRELYNGALDLNTDEDQDVVKGSKLVIVNGDQKAYQVSQLTGYIQFGEIADDCHPILNADAVLTFVDMPVYLMMGKIALPTDPQAYYDIDVPGNSRVARVATASIDTKPEHSKPGYESGCKYDSTLCGMILVAKGRVRLTTGTAQDAPSYSGTCEYVSAFTDGVTNFPRLNEIGTNRMSSLGGSTQLEAYLNRLDAVCHLVDLPLALPGSWKCDLVQDVATNL